MGTCGALGTATIVHQVNSCVVISGFCNVIVTCRSVTLTHSLGLCVVGPAVDAGNTVRVRVSGEYWEQLHQVCTTHNNKWNF